MGVMWKHNTSGVIFRDTLLWEIEFWCDIFLKGTAHTTQAGLVLNTFESWVWKLDYTQPQQRDEEEVYQDLVGLRTGYIARHFRGAKYSSLLITFSSESPGWQVITPSREPPANVALQFASHCFQKEMKEDMCKAYSLICRKVNSICFHTMACKQNLVIVIFIHTICFDYN